MQFQSKREVSKKSSFGIWNQARNEFTFLISLYTLYKKGDEFFESDVEYYKFVRT